VGVKWAVMVGGTGSNLKALLDAGVEVVHVVSHRAGVGALDIARDAGVPATVVEPGDYEDREAFDAAVLAALDRIPVDGVVMAGFLRKIGPTVVRRYAGRMINLHPSLLPAFPGLHAARQALRHGVKVTGVTVHYVTEDLDAGPIIAQEAVPVEADDGEDTLMARLHAVEHRLLPAVVRRLEREGLAGGPGSDSRQGKEEADAGPVEHV
jgi:phosphoribosylglycinamide formyltransferase-1